MKPAECTKKSRRDLIEPPELTVSVHWWVELLAVGTLALAALIAYNNTFSSPFFFDDEPSITENATIRQLWPLAGPLNPPAGAGVTNRPLVNLSLALNYAVGGLHVEGYHVFNLTVHLLAALALYGIVRRTLRQPVLRERYGAAAQTLAWLTSLWWLVHPLQTESVTCVIQRTESLMGLLYLAALYAAIRAMNSDRPRWWKIAAVVATLAGMATKEVMVSAPLLIYLYDRTFVAGSFREAWQRRRGFYLSLVLTWVLLGWLVLDMARGTRGGTCDFNGEITTWQYLATQSYAIDRYLWLSLWPHPLVVDYGQYLVTNSAVIVSCGLVVVGMGVGTVVALWRWPVWGFVGTWFFAILAPSSSILPLITQTMAEHRMYLPLATVVVVVVLGLYRYMKGLVLPFGVAISVGLMAVTVARNHDYRSNLSIWEDTVEKWPDQARAQATLGGILASDPKLSPTAIRHLEYAIQLSPEYATAYNNLGLALSKESGRTEEAITALEKAVAIKPDLAVAQANLGAVLTKVAGRDTEAIEHLRKALQLKPELADAEATLGAILLADKAQSAEAIFHLQQAIRLDPGNAEAHANLGTAYSNDSDHFAEALLHLKTAIRLGKDLPQVWNSLAVILSKMPGHQPEAISAFNSALKLNPEYWEAHSNLGMLEIQIEGRKNEALGNLAAAARFAPENADVRSNLGFALLETPGRLEDAAREFAAVAKLRSDSPDAHFNFGTALTRLTGREQEATEQFETVLRLNPNDADAHNSLGVLLSHIPAQRLEAEAHFEKALGLNPALVEAHLNLAKLLFLRPDRNAELIRELETVLRLAPDNQQALALLAQAEIKK